MLRLFQAGPRDKARLLVINRDISHVDQSGTLGVKEVLTRQGGALTETWYGGALKVFATPPFGATAGFSSHIPNVA